MKKMLSFLLAATLILAGFAGCSGDKKDSAKLSPDVTGATMKNGVSVELGEYVLEGGTELTVTKQTTEENKDEGYKIEAYDFKLGELTELGDYITLRIPYDTTYCEEGQDPSKCVGAKYKNEDTGEWEDVLFEVDAEANELIIYTDHLSIFGAFYVKNEGRRNAYITDVRSDVSGVDQQQAMAALREYVASGGAAGEKAVDLAAQIITGYNGFLGGIGGAADQAGFAMDVPSTVLSIVSLGGPSFDSALATSAYEKLGQLGKVAAAVKIGAVMLSTEKTDADVLGLYKDAAMLALSFAESRALGLASGGLFIFDYTISNMFEQGMAIKMGKLDEVYVYFNDKFSGQVNEGSGGAWKARTLKDWRQTLIDIAEANPDEADAKAAIEAEIDRYARHFWTLGDMEKAVVVTDIEDKGTVGSVSIPYPTTSEIETLVGAYKAHLYERLYPVINSVSIYMQRKAEAEYLAALNNVKAFYNQVITVNIVEDIPEGESSKYEGYTLRFAPLSETAVKENWTGTLKAAGGITTKFTLLGFLQAGSPAKLQIFSPDSDPDSAEPDLTLGFKLTAPVTEVIIGGAPTFDEMVGTYEDGTMTITSVFISDDLRAEMENSKGSGEKTGNILTDGCDFSMFLALEEQIGVAREAPFVIKKTGENAGTMIMNDDPGIVSYDPNSGALTFAMSYDEDGASMGGLSGELNCSYINDMSGVMVSGSLKMLLFFPEEEFYAMVEVTGTKGVQTP